MLDATDPLTGADSHHDDECTSISSSRPLILVTDCHPTILSRTTVGKEEDGAVMYIGPDSLALVQHLPIQSHLMHLMQHLHLHLNKKKKRNNFQILDFCTGSGVQALATLMSLENVDPGATAVCVDVNDRALRFTKFNALLNGIDGGRVHTIKADLISGKLLDPRDASNCNCFNSRKEQDGMAPSILDILLKGAPATNSQIIPTGPFDIILANPPFIPTPSAGDDTSDGISKRYGLFSSGGSSGEEVLQSIVSMSSRLLRKEDGLLAIVSEFMNPPTTNTNHPTEDEAELNAELLQKMSHWWQDAITEGEETTASIISRTKGKGILFTNEQPVSASTYASRRADDASEYTTWLQHLETCNIHCVSPGQLYIRTTGDDARSRNSSDAPPQPLHLTYRLVPKDDELGSIWTPYNHKAVAYTRREWESVMMNIRTDRLE